MRDEGEQLQSATRLISLIVTIRIISPLVPSSNTLPSSLSSSSFLHLTAFYSLFYSTLFYFALSSLFVRLFSSLLKFPFFFSSFPFIQEPSFILTPPLSSFSSKPPVLFFSFWSSHLYSFNLLYTFPLPFHVSFHLRSSSPFIFSSISLFSFHPPVYSFLSLPSSPPHFSLKPFLSSLFYCLLSFYSLSPLLLPPLFFTLNMFHILLFLPLLICLLCPLLSCLLFSTPPYFSLLFCLFPLSPLPNFHYSNILLSPVCPLLSYFLKSLFLSFFLLSSPLLSSSQANLSHHSGGIHKGTGTV